MPPRPGSALDRCSARSGGGAGLKLFADTDGGEHQLRLVRLMIPTPTHDDPGSFCWDSPRLETLDGGRSTFGAREYTRSCVRARSCVPRNPMLPDRRRIEESNTREAAEMAERDARGKRFAGSVETGHWKLRGSAPAPGLKVSRHVRPCGQKRGHTSGRNEPDARFGRLAARRIVGISYTNDPHGRHGTGNKRSDRFTKPLEYAAANYC